VYLKAADKEQEFGEDFKSLNKGQKHGENFKPINVRQDIGLKLHTIVLVSAVITHPITL
jgi:hypothetical protein